MGAASAHVRVQAVLGFFSRRRPVLRCAHPSPACHIRPTIATPAAELYPVPPRAETCGRTEEYIGRWMAARGNRASIVLATKVMGGAKVGWGGVG